MNLRLRFFIQYSRVKDLWHCVACRQISNIRDYEKMVIIHKPDCKYIALKTREEA